MSASFLFYDLETFGTDPRRSRIAQFAAIRTDAELNEIDAPLDFLIAPAHDLLPTPAATLVTGLAPQRAAREGISEAEAMARIFEEMSRPETCTVGYNSLRFDDEFVRYGFWRNFFDPYEREWRGGNSRWDLLDVMRLAHALRPDGIVWRQREDGGGTSFRLEHLAEDNGLREGMAHEALSDVRALIGLARTLKAAQPRLWEYALGLRDKRAVMRMLDAFAMQPLLHVSQRFPAARLCAAPVIPLTRHPQIDSRVIVFDLGQEIEPLLRLDAEGIADRLYVSQRDLPAGETRIALKEVHANRCPALVEWGHLREADFERLGIDPAVVEARAAELRRHGPKLAEKIRQVFARPRDWSDADADGALYDGFVGDGDKRLMPQLRAIPPERFREGDIEFRDARLNELLWRYRARNWPQHLTFDEQERWYDYRRRRLLEDSGLGEMALPQWRAEIAALREAHADDTQALHLLDQLQAWGDMLEAEVA
ncbi:exodeoxyribonuclease I [Luteimonas sp. e5]